MEVFPGPSDNALFVIFLFVSLFVMYLLTRIDNNHLRNEIRYYRNPERRHINRRYYDD